MSASASWATAPERGSLLLLRLMAGLALGVGWHAGNALLYPITAYFLLFSRRARAASRGFLTAALGREPGPRDLFRHYFTFASTLLDRAFLLTGRLAGFDIRVEGLGHVRRHVEAGRGCILLGSHLGSFEVLRALADREGCPVPVRILMYEGNAARANSVFNGLNPGRAASVIRIGETGALLRVKEALAAGELVGILGDRTVAGEKVVAARFMGRRALLPAGPIVLAGVLAAPVVLFSGVRRGPRRYDILFEPFADRVDLGRRASREADVAAWVRRYAAAVEARALAHPYNWFNFYDFWDRQGGAGVARARGGAPPGRGDGRAGRDRRADGGPGRRAGEPGHVR